MVNGNEILYFIQCKVHDCITVIQKGAKQAATDVHVVHFDYN